MLPTFDNNLEASVFLWLENLLVKKGQGFANYSGQLVPAPSLINGWNAYSAPQRQMVYDSSVSGANVPTGVYINGNFTSFSSGLQLNYNQGTLYSSAPISAPITCNFAYKDVNLYFANNPEERILFKQKFSVNPRSSNNHNPKPEDQVYPCIFIKMSAGENETLTFDKLFSKKIKCRLTFLSDTPYLYRAVTSMLRDCKELFIPVFDPPMMPFNFYGNLVSGSFSYDSSKRAIQQDINKLVKIKEASISDFSDEVNSLIDNQVYGGFIDLTLENLGYTPPNLLT